MKSEKGFALLFAVLVSSVLLSIGISIFNITLKEIVLSSSGRESQFAFYAADTGAECALYWDFKGTDIFATSSASRTPNPVNPDCVGQAINITPSSQTSNSAETTFNITIPNTDYLGNPFPNCAIVTVTKEDTVSSGIVFTTIYSRGYNTDCSSTDTNRVERALRATY
jgi:Tfp pilus assembly protein PilX